jgi:flagellum-specific ATP synthase
MSARPLFADRLQPWLKQIPDHIAPRQMGRISCTVGLTLQAVGCTPALGARCWVELAAGRHIEAEVVGFSGEIIHLMPLDKVDGLSPGARVIPLELRGSVPVGAGLLGRVINGRGQAIDGRGPLNVSGYYPLQSQTLNPLARKPIRQPLDVGVRSINGLLTVGRGQRIGLFAGSGVGKSVLMGMMTRFTQADVVIVGLIGERGREVKEFIEDILAEAGLRRAIVVASPADDPALVRLQAAMTACSLAEYFRDQGQDVLLLMDSLTRFAQAAREIAIASGEPPASKGYSPSVFYRLTQLAERAGNAADEDGRKGGSITAIYTVLTEGDDQMDPIAESARAILDGHIVLSRRLAEEGIYPAVDVEASISRAMSSCVSAQWLSAAQQLKKWVSVYQQNRDLISIGAYIAGTDVNIDQAIAMMPKIRDFLAQATQQAASIQETEQALYALVAQATQLQRSSAETIARDKPLAKRR